MVLLLLLLALLLFLLLPPAPHPLNACLLVRLHPHITIHSPMTPPFYPTSNSTPASGPNQPPSPDSSLNCAFVSQAVIWTVPFSCSHVFRIPHFSWNTFLLGGRWQPNLFCPANQDNLTPKRFYYSRIISKLQRFIWHMSRSRLAVV